MLLPPGCPWPATGWPRGLQRRMCAPTGQRSPRGSPDPSLLTYSKLFNSSVADSLRRGIRVRRQRQRNAVAPAAEELGGQQFRIDAVLVRLQKVLEADNVLLHHLEHAETSVAPERRRTGQLVVVGVVRQNEEPRLARLLMIGRHGFRTALDPWRDGEAVGVPEVNLRDGHGLAVHQLRHGGAVHLVQQLEGLALLKQSDQAAAVRFHRLRARGVKPHHHVIVSGAETSDPMLRSAVSVVTDSPRPRCRTLDEGVKGSGRN